MENIQSLEQYSLSDTDIKRILPGIKIIAYPQLAKYDNIFQLFDAQGRCVIFFEEDESSQGIQGHWEIILMNKMKNTIDFFDSYGLKYDECRKWLAKNKLIQLKEFDPQIGRLLATAPKQYRIFYNHKRFQSMKPGNNECGRYVCTRGLQKNLSDMEFIQFMNNLKKQYNVTTYDEAVTNYIFDNFGI